MNENDKQLASVLEKHQTITVVGGNWGDEGKGKVIDFVMSQYNIAARFSGGSNAGHTVKTPSGVKVVSHLIPCGVAQNKECVLARGEFIDLRLFIEEYQKTLEALNGAMPKVWLDEQSPLWTPWHGLLEAWIEHCRGFAKVGTTGKGIGPLEGLFKLRIGPLVGHLSLGKEKFIKQLEVLHKTLLPIFEEMQKENLVPEGVPSQEQVADQLLALFEQVKEKVVDTSFVLHKNLGEGKRILFEGAQALGLDSHWGMYPFVSSGNSAASGASVGTGLPMNVFDSTLMVVKTLPTRVGGGPFVSEMWNRQSAMDFAKEHAELFSDKALAADFLAEKLQKINSGTATGAEMSQYFQVLGDERGATTGRGRSVGFMDIPWLLYAIRVNGPKWIALTRFDMLSGITEMPVVTQYKHKGEILPPGKFLPPWELDKAEGITEKWQGFSENIFNISKESELPKEAREFLTKLEQRLKVPILLVGTGPGRDAIIVRG